MQIIIKIYETERADTNIIINKRQKRKEIQKNENNR